MGIQIKRCKHGVDCLSKLSMGRTYKLDKDEPISTLLLIFKQGHRSPPQTSWVKLNIDGAINLFTSYSLVEMFRNVEG